jgi:hypothetical protein
MLESLGRIKNPCQTVVACDKAGSLISGSLRSAYKGIPLFGSSPLFFRLFFRHIILRSVLDL